MSENPYHPMSWEYAMWDTVKATVQADGKTASRFRFVYGHLETAEGLERCWADGDWGCLAYAAWLGYDGLRTDLIDLYIRKQKDYGTANILKFGIEGVRIRLWDKIARYQNLTSKKDPWNESVQDTLADIVGYVAIILMLADDTFTLPMQDELPATVERYVVERRRPRDGEYILDPFSGKLGPVSGWDKNTPTGGEIDYRLVIVEE